MRRNWYAAGLLLLLILAVYSAGVYVDRSLRTLDQELASAYACAEQGAYRQARDTFRETARDAQRSSKLWLLLIRRSLVDQLNQTLATLPHYVTEENLSDLAVETARAREQARQMRLSFFGRL